MAIGSQQCDGTWRFMGVSIPVCSQQACYCTAVMPASARLASFEPWVPSEREELGRQERCCTSPGAALKASDMKVACLTTKPCHVCSCALACIGKVLGQGHSTCPYMAVP